MSETQWLGLWAMLTALGASIAAVVAVGVYEISRKFKKGGKR